MTVLIGVEESRDRDLEARDNWKTSFQLSGTPVLNRNQGWSWMGTEVQREKCGERNKRERKHGNKAESQRKRIELEGDLRQSLKGCLKDLIQMWPYSETCVLALSACRDQVSVRRKRRKDRIGKSLEGEKHKFTIKQCMTL